MLQTIATTGQCGACGSSEIVNSDVSGSELFEVQLSVLLVAHILLAR
jgi:hypothetical protein